MKRIIAPIDFSPASMNAVEYAVDLAITIKASLSLIHICEYPIPFSEIPLPPETLPDMIDDAEEKMNSLIKRLKVLSADKIEIYSTIGSGLMIKQLQDYCALIKPDIVIMGTHKTSDIERIFLGSKTIAAVKHLDWPLFIVPPDTRFKQIRKIGLACSLKNEHDPFPIALVRSIVQDFNAELHVLHVQKDKVYSQETIDAAETLIPQLEGLHPSYHFINERNLQRGIAEIIEMQHIDLLVMVPQHRHITESLFHQSQTKQFVLHSRLPVMSIHI